MSCQVVTGRECDDAAHCPYGREAALKSNGDNGGDDGKPKPNPKPPRHDTRQQLRLAKLPPYLCFRLLRFDNSLKKVCVVLDGCGRGKCVLLEANTKKGGRSVCRGLYAQSFVCPNSPSLRSFSTKAI